MWLYKHLKQFLYIQYLYLFYFDLDCWNYIKRYKIIIDDFDVIVHGMAMYDDTILSTSFTVT